MSNYISWFSGLTAVFRLKPSDVGVITPTRLFLAFLVVHLDLRKGSVPNSYKHDWYLLSRN